MARYMFVKLPCNLTVDAGPQRIFGPHVGLEGAWFRPQSIPSCLLSQHRKSDGRVRVDFLIGKPGRGEIDHLRFLGNEPHQRLRIVLALASDASLALGITNTASGTEARLLISGSRTHAHDGLVWKCHKNAQQACQWSRNCGTPCSHKTPSLKTRPNSKGWLTCQGYCIVENSCRNACKQNQNFEWSPGGTHGSCLLTVTCTQTNNSCAIVFSEAKFYPRHVSHYILLFSDSTWHQLLTQNSLSPNGRNVKRQKQHFWSGMVIRHKFQYNFRHLFWNNMWHCSGMYVVSSCLFWHVFWHLIGQLFWHISDISSGIICDMFHIYAVRQCPTLIWGSA